MWEQIRANQKKSVLIVMFMAALLVAIGYVIGLYFFESPYGGIVLALIVWAIMYLVAFSQGDSILLSLSNARKVSKQDFPQLYNVVEEMTIASGLPKIPDVYVIDDPSLNAFATGRNPEKASVAVTSGLLQKLNRDELQGVIAHEIGHVKNRDTFLMAIGGIMLGAIVILAYFASRMLFFGGMSRGRRGGGGGGGGAQIIILVAGIALMILAPIAARLLYLSLSRKREYLADASSALYTRYPEGLASALEKISSSTTPVKSANNATAPMYIVNPFRKAKRAASDLSSTHPSTTDRVRVLRAMGGASYKDYQTAYKEAHRGQGVLPSGSVEAVGTASLRSSTDSSGGGSDAPVMGAREVSQAMWKSSGYRTIACECGGTLRIPPGVDASSVRCPRCNTVHKL